MLDFMLQTGPYGAGFGVNPDGASLALLQANPHGVDYRALEPRLHEILRTPSDTIELAHPAPFTSIPTMPNALVSPRSTSHRSDADDGSRLCGTGARSCIVLWICGQLLRGSWAAAGCSPVIHMGFTH